MDDKLLSHPTTASPAPPWPRPHTHPASRDISPPSLRKPGDVLGHESLDPVLNTKMRLVNDAIDEIGMTWYQWKLFCLNGFGYAVDSQILLVQSIIATQAQYEFAPSFANGLTIAAYVGMLLGALFWGLSADVIGRKYAFNLSLLISSVFCVVAGASPDWVVLGLFTCLAAFGSGGNLVLDTAVFLEYLPSRNQWLLTLMAAWWGLGQLVAGLFAWAFLPSYSCPGVPSKTGVECDWRTNPGWRYVWFANGGLVFVMSILRITVIRLKETPKFALGEGKDQEVVDTLQFIARKYHRPCGLTIEHLRACGETDLGHKEHARRRFSLTEVGIHIKGLYATRKMALSTTLIWWSWLLIGLAYPLYNVFLPEYLASRGAALGGLSVYDQWRNYAIANVCSIPSPILAGYMCKSRVFWGRRGTMIVGALLTMAFFFAYTQVKSNAENLGFTCAIGFCLGDDVWQPRASDMDVWVAAERYVACSCGGHLSLKLPITALSVYQRGFVSATSVDVRVAAVRYIACFALEQRCPLRTLWTHTEINEWLSKVAKHCTLRSGGGAVSSGDVGDAGEESLESNDHV
ncbi:MFS general substrate transporter [Teratosphaeria nubilosa]|uniref:MFS general substrate transporter n=1 Tax=Teratosphaeria nubilosa TaxID=161662 RepID=A0A6G1KWE0_9PEZI|nr:MFS general substrate transporter [Teratosphaeria nubilosa]